MIKINQYKKICASAKKILNEFSYSKFIFSINELHVVRPHPVFLDKYKVVYEKFFFLKIFYITIKNLLRIIASLLLGVFEKKYEHNNLKNYKYVFFSHLFSKSQISAPTEKDVYYSHICSNLNKKHYCVVYLNHVGKNNCKNNNKVFLNKRLSFLKELNIFLDLIRSSLKLFKKSLVEKNNFNKRFYLFIFANCISVSTLSNLRIFYQSYEIISKINPKKVTVTYEGHAFERNIFRAVHKINNKIQKVAFHHSLLFNNQFAYTMKFNNGSNPDVILASGKSSYDKLKKIIRINKKNFLLVGSNRISNKKNNNKKLHYNYNNCLVLPEGIESETKLFLKFIKKYINKYNDLNFTIRLHPILNNKSKEFQKFYSQQDLDKKKIIFSNNKNPVDDFNINNFCLYRGTSLIFDAMQHGLLPFYLLNGKEIIFDPLFNSQIFFSFNKIDNIDQFHKTIKKNRSKQKIIFSNPYILPNKRIIKNFYN
jgi:hypothetical protein